jgi:hypothetical protein
MPDTNVASASNASVTITLDAVQEITGRWRGYACVVAALDAATAGAYHRCCNELMDLIYGPADDLPF